MIWTSIQLGYLHFTVYNLSYHTHIHTLSTIPYAAPSDIEVLTHWHKVG